ncbi:phospho-N-acetylmuramoyl-pentapeptide-transferase [Sulfoacidibacillus thermotolerans]|uniref:Phospho-N-acetylmuramoyl-pentapeptide-transferase n=1 Tax=Sulfoacidibacillus thermotolerans TaxID=1765684 RepID=A0A2U3D8V6_SULT2|nr:phospho-N-acetylmuramoyl-pentapeptide-transferase [Sulfoacidibacillus thermotolerans]PWI57705.1 phospho-N-acetylmuramoyl-pentapeptide-transferase [Sulfoacidibacillus thermotolerans]
MDAQSLSWILVVSFAIVVLLGPIAIPLLQRLKFGQAIRAEGPARHQQKSGTPTMGGMMILLSVVFTALRFSSSPTTDLLIFAMVGFGIIGLLDDGIKVLRHRNLGLTARQKLVLQVLVVVLFYLFLYFRGWHFELYIPGFNTALQLGPFYLIFLAFFMIGTANAVNITDGLDGLAAGTTAIAFAAFAAMAWWESQWNISVFAMATVGALLGFLVYNRHPAKVFMGDTGSLALGGGLAAVAVLTRSEIWLALIGGIFVIEALSVIIQVISFQSFGRRVFKMSPLHHHFELIGWSEWRVVTTFWLVGLALSIAALYFYVR